MAPVEGKRVQMAAHMKLNGSIHTQLAPPSSILATHLAPANGNGLPNFDRESFAQLIDVCLGSDENAQSNLGDDVAVNLRLICVIFKAGIDRVHASKDDPFKIPGRDADQIIRCLEVIERTIQRSPSVLYALAGPNDLDPADSHVPLFVWLVAKLSSMIGDCEEENVSITSKAGSLISTILALSADCSINHNKCKTMWAFIASCISGRCSISPARSKISNSLKNS